MTALRGNPGSGAANSADDGFGGELGFDLDDELDPLGGPMDRADLRILSDLLAIYDLSLIHI